MPKKKKKLSQKEEKEAEDCAICLQPISKRTVLDGCAHKYCWECILEWSKVTNRCPTCKIKFACISHRDLNGAVVHEQDVKEKEQHNPDDYTTADADRDFGEYSEDNLLDDEAEEGSSDDSNLSDSEIERQKERIRTWRSDLFNEHEKFSDMSFGSDSEDSATKRQRRIEAERAEYSSGEEELRNIIQLEEYDSDDGFIVNDDDSISMESAVSELHSFEKADLEDSESNAEPESHMNKNLIAGMSKTKSRAKTSPVRVLAISDDSEAEVEEHVRHKQATTRRRLVSRRIEDTDSEPDLEGEISRPFQASVLKAVPLNRRRVIDDDDDDTDDKKTATSSTQTKKPPATNPDVDCAGADGTEKSKKRKRNKKRGKKKKRARESDSLELTVPSAKRIHLPSQ